MAVMAANYPFDHTQHFRHFGLPSSYHTHLTEHDIARAPLEPDEDYSLVVRQQPDVVKVALSKEQDRKSIDPPPVVELKVSRRIDPTQNFLQSPYCILICSIVNDNEPEKDLLPTPLVGTLVSSIHRLKDPHNNEGGFFVFGDLSVKEPGDYRLKFTLYKQEDGQYQYIAGVTSQKFSCLTARSFPGTRESTALTRCFHEQGVRLRIRKDSRTVNSKRAKTDPAERSSSQPRAELESSRVAGSKRPPNFVVPSSHGHSISDWAVAATSVPGSRYGLSGVGGIEDGTRSLKRRRTMAELNTNVGSSYYTDFSPLPSTIPSASTTVSLPLTSWDLPTHRLTDSITTIASSTYSPSAYTRSAMPSTDQGYYDPQGGRHMAAYASPTVGSGDFARPRTTMPFTSHESMLSGNPAMASSHDTRRQADLVSPLQHQYSGAALQPVTAFDTMGIGNDPFSGQTYYQQPPHR